MIERWSGVLAGRARAVMLLGILVVLGAGAYGLGVFSSLSQGGFDDPGSETSQELQLERAAFGNQSVDVVAIYSSDTLSATSPQFEQSVRGAVSSLPPSAIASVTTYYDAPSDRAAGMVSTDGRAGQVLISLTGESQADYLKSYDAISPHLDAVGLHTDVAGSYAVYHDVNKITSSDLARAELITMPIVILLALLIFGSLVAASLPALVGTVAMLGALAVVRLMTLFTEVSVFAVNVVSLIGIGLAIDYSLFVISRFREELALIADDEPDAASIAIRRTMSTAGRTVLFSGLTVAAAMSSLLIFPQAFLRSMGYGGVAAVVVAMAAALTVLPATLRLLGRRIDNGRLPWRRGKVAVDADEHGAWARLARGVMGRPVLAAVGVVVLLLAVASPFLGVRWGSVDYRTLPDSAPSNVAAAKLNTDFGAEHSTASLLLRGTPQTDVAAYEKAALDVPGVDAIQRVAQQGDTTLLLASWTGNSQTEQSQQIVTDLRGIDPPVGSALVGGLSAETVDLVHSVGVHLPWMAVIVVAVMLLLLFLAFGSVVLPVKAVVMNLFSITASFGVVTWIFSDGHLSGPLGFTPQGFLDATNPILMLAVLFGLSMDYEVFLLSRVREQWDRTHDNDLAVATGVQKTGRIITSAALLLGVVIGAFGTSGIVFMKMLGLGMLVALLIDATIVRAILVPAAMKLLGDWNWYAPGPLRRWWERHGFHEEPAAQLEPCMVELVDTAQGTST